MPVCIDFGALVNPHIAIVGATGSGKTYLLKSIIARFSLDELHRIVLIDWNGEYTDTVNAIGGVVVSARKGMRHYGIQQALHVHRILGVRLSDMELESERRECAISALQEAIAEMIAIEPGKATNTLVVVDEAWKLAGGGELQQLFREGRKYGFAVAIATQLAGDMSGEILANAACRFTFRITGQDNAAQLDSKGVVSNAARAAELGVGSCIMSMAMKDGRNAEFVIERVDGFALREHIINGGKMNVRVSNQRLQRLILDLDATEASKARIRELIAVSPGTIQLNELVEAMAAAGLGRAEVVWFLREIGVDDASIVRAYSNASPIAVDDYEGAGR